MTRKITIILLTLSLLFSFSSPLLAQSKVQGYAGKGGTTVVTQGLNSTKPFQISYPSCTISVFETGTATLSTVFADGASTPKANPFTADSTGYWFFWANNGTYDVQFSGTGITTPFTLTGYKIGDASSGVAGSGTANRLAKFSASATIANSQITDNATSVGINNTSPAATALLDLTSTTQGFLPPRMTTAQRDSIASPATGLVIYNTTTGAVNVYSGSSWGVIGGSGITSLGGLTGASQSFAVGTTGTDFAVVSSGTSHTFNIPDASATARGLVTTGTQTIAGAKTFTSNLIAPLVDNGGYGNNPKENGVDTSGVTSATTALAQTITDLPAGGGVLLLPAGTYLLDTTWTISKANVTIRGAGIGNTIIKRGATLTGNLISLSATNITLSDLTIDANIAATGNNSNTNVEVVCATGAAIIQRIELKSFYGIGINAATSNNRVLDSIITGSGATAGSNLGQYGVWFASSSANNTIISRNVFSATRESGIYGGGTGVLVTDNVFTGCHVETSTGGGQIAFGSTTQKNIVIANNIIRAGGGSLTTGIEIDVNGGVTIQNNTIIDQQRYGIILQDGTVIDATNCLVQGNTVKNSGLSAIFVSANMAGFVIIGNRCFDDAGAGGTQDWGVEVAVGTSTNYVIANNDLRGNVNTAGLSDGGTGTSKQILGNLPSTLANTIYGAMLFPGVLSAGSSPTTLTDSAGKILSAALNTVAVAQGGTGVTSSTGSVAVVLSTSPTLVTPVLGVATHTSLTGATLHGGTGASSTLTVNGTNHGTPSAADILLNSGAAYGTTVQGAVRIGTTSGGTYRLVVADDATLAVRFITTASGGSAGITAGSIVTPVALNERMAFYTYGNSSGIGGTVRNAVLTGGYALQAWTDGSIQGAFYDVQTTPIGSATRNVREIIGVDKTLTDAATSLFEIAIPAAGMVGGQIEWTIVASDGTDHQAFSGITLFAVVNKAGVYTKTFTNNTSNDAKAVSAGTLTATWAGVDGSNKVTVQVTPTGSLVETTYKIYYKVINNNPRAITLL